MPGFRIEIRDGRVRLEHLFRARLWWSPLDPESLPTLAYQKLIAMAEQADVETELPEAELSLA
jgi:hypothetical protein